MAEELDDAQIAWRVSMYEEINRILTQAGRITPKKFHKAENEEELIEMLEHTIAHLNGLLVELQYKDKVK